MNQLHSIVDGLLGIADLPDMLNSIQHTIEKCVRAEFRRSKHTHLVWDREDIQGPVSNDGRHLMATKPINAVTSQDAWYDQFWRRKRVVTRRTGRDYSSWFGISAWFGVVRVQERTVKTYEKEENGEPTNLRETLEMDIFFTPASWLRDKRFAATALRWIDCRLQRPSLAINLQCVNVISDDSPIWEAVYSCNLREIRRLFDRGLASPADRNTSGYTLLHWLMEVLIPHLDPSRCLYCVLMFAKFYSIDLVMKASTRTISCQYVVISWISGYILLQRVQAIDCGRSCTVTQKFG